MSEWKEVTLGDLVHIKHGWAFKGEFFAEDGNLIVVTPGNFLEEGGFRVREGKEKFYTDDFPKEFLLTKDDLIIAMTEQGVGLLGSPALITEDNRFLHNQRIGLFQNFKKDQIFKKYMYYLFFTQYIRGMIAGSSTGTKVKHTAPKRIYNIKIKLPSLRTQKKIAKILSNYDDLMENNLKRIKLLEESAMLTYEELFLRFRIDGKKLEIDSETGLPYRWEKVNLESLISHHIGGGWGDDVFSDEFSEDAYVIRGTDFDEIPYGKLNGVPYRYHKKSNLASRKLKCKDIVFEVSGGSRTEGVAKSLLITDELLKQFDSDVMCASFCKLVRARSNEYANILFLFFRFLRNIKGTEVFEIRSASSIVNYNWTAFIKHQQIIFPDNNILTIFNEKIDAIYNEIYNLGHQNQLLKEARDILLPRLMTGMIDVEDIEVAV